ncbi:carboxymuconolactone decarboxylase family protein [Acidithiobacillus sp.]|uniref:carboxymuconolactone decarboxylase family protein n=1 Tax=Acidithiobacillus sp. TaxID=1872118 RepID=UPI0032AF4953
MSTEHTRIDYLSFTKAAPEVYAALSAIGKAVADSGLEKSLTELIKVRVSQMNGCAFCIQYHLNAARQIGLEAVKLDLVAGWRDAGIFSAREQAALAWAECLTALATQGAPDAVYETLRSQFTETEVTFLTVAIGAINFWNRLGVGLRFSPPIPRTEGRL